MTELHHEVHFQDLRRQIYAARFGMWLFLASEVLLFAALITLYVYYRVAWPRSFALGVDHSSKLLGSLNTIVLLCSSYSVALAVHALEQQRSRRSVRLLLLTILLAGGFLFIKGLEYASHLREGIRPGLLQVPYAPSEPGAAMFVTLYYVLTGAHALHVLAGASVLAWFAWRIHRGKLASSHSYRLELAALYWHLVDIVWIFLWPLFYLTGTHG